MLSQAALYPEWQLARVVAQHRGAYELITAQGRLPAELPGKFLNDAKTPSDYPAVGDFVMVSRPEQSARALIHQLLARKSLFTRKAVGKEGQLQVVAANIDIVFLCMSLNRNFSLNRLERLLAVAWDSGATPVVLLTKADLCEELDARLADVARVCAYCDTLSCSMFDEQALQAVAAYLKPGVTAAFVGSSGVGKSTLINGLLGQSMIETAEVGAGDKGRHTTTGRELFPTPYGGAVMDTPGMREMGAATADLSSTFSDIEALAAACRFRDCSHEGEDGCALAAALESGELERRRYDSFVKLRRESSYEGLSAKELETQKLERMFREVGGIKGARKFIKNKQKGR